MSSVAEVTRPFPVATDGRIAAINLESSRRRAWERFARDPHRRGGAEEIVDQESLALQFLGDLDALDRLDALGARLAREHTSFHAPLVQARVASAAHRFDDARGHLARATRMGAPHEEIKRHTLTIDQACGLALDDVLETRRRIAAATRSLEDLVPLGAVLADLEQFAEADAIYRQAFDAYDGLAPFPLAWVSFQLGQLWGELVPEPNAERAALWYRRAIAYLPGYVKARVHLAEVRASQGDLSDAAALLLPALTSGDPEVPWRLADVLTAQGKTTEARTYLDSAQVRFEQLLQGHLLAFADHAAEFYAGSGNDRTRAVELALANVANRPTRRAIAEADAIRAQDERTTIPRAPNDVETPYRACTMREIQESLHDRSQ